jgi:phage tail-like protein
MTEISSYLQYLPSVLWAHENDRQQLLGRTLRIFEKILTGIDDGVAIGDYGKSYPSLEELIDSLPSFFNPRRTPDADFLPWLASWVALELRPEWTEYQRRQITDGIVSVYRLRGLTQGLYTYLDIYAQTEARPRIVIDDGKAVLRLRFLPDGTAALTTVAYSQVVTFPATDERSVVHTPVLIHPTAIAIDSHNDYFVVDQGAAVTSDIKALQRPALWKISSTGKIAYTQAEPLPVPRPLQTGSFFEDATAVVVDDQDRCSVIKIGKLKNPNSQESILRRFTPPDYASFIDVINPETIPSLPVVRPTDMVLDAGQNFVILDRGAHLTGDPPSGFTAAPKLVVVSEDPLSVEEHPLPDVVEPTALARAADGTYIVADAGKLNSGDPADLWRVDPANDWRAVSLLGALQIKANPLIFPTGLVFDSPSVLMVCDTGLRWGFTQQDRGNRAMAEPAAVYSVDLSRTPPVIVRLTREQQLVNPIKMARDRQGKIIVVDMGESLRRLTLRNWRARPNELGVVVHFSQQRSTTIEERNQTRRGIAAVIEEQKPAHASWWLKSD